MFNNLFLFKKSITTAFSSKMNNFMKFQCLYRLTEKLLVSDRRDSPDTRPAACAVRPAFGKRIRPASPGRRKIANPCRRAGSATAPVHGHSRGYNQSGSIARFCITRFKEKPCPRKTENCEFESLISIVNLKRWTSLRNKIFGNIEDAAFKRLLGLLQMRMINFMCSARTTTGALRTAFVCKGTLCH